MKERIRLLKVLFRYELGEYWFPVVKFPLILGVIGFVFGLINRPSVYSVSDLLFLNASGSQILIYVFLFFTVLVMYYYFSHCLFNDRQDGSLFYWMSMPISQPFRIVSKVLFGGCVIPVISLGVYFLALAAYLLGLAVIYLMFNLDSVFLIFKYLFSFQGFVYFMYLYGVSVLIACGIFLSLFFWFMFSLFLSSVLKKSPFLLMILVPIGMSLLLYVLFGMADMVAIWGTIEAMFFGIKGDGFFLFEGVGIIVDVSKGLWEEWTGFGRVSHDYDVLPFFFDYFYLFLLPQLVMGAGCLLLAIKKRKRGD